MSVETKIMGQKNAVLEMGWGRLAFGQTFTSQTALVEAVLAERPGQRNIAMYLTDPHVSLSLAPQELFLDPSHTFRLRLRDYTPREDGARSFRIRPVRSRADLRELNRLYATRGMVQLDAERGALDPADSGYSVLHWVAEAEGDESGNLLGGITAVDHVAAFADPERGSSFWSLAVDPQAVLPGIGEALVRAVAELMLELGRETLDLSVLHDNVSAIALYEKLGFERVRYFTLKRKNTHNEPLFVAPRPEKSLNPYAQLILDEARRRGIGSEVLSEDPALFTLEVGGRTVRCHESLTDLTTSVSVLLCDRKQLTHRLLRGAGLRVPDQLVVGDDAASRAFLERHRRIVVKPSRGEQGRGVHVDVRTEDELRAAVAAAAEHDTEVLLEEMVEGEDLRVVVIGYEVVAAAVRRPPAVEGDGEHDLRFLIEKYSRRRMSATGGESCVPVDEETRRTLAAAGCDLDTVLPAGQRLVVRRTANLHTGGTIHDVTARLHPDLAAASCHAARALAIPVVGLDLMVPDVEGPEYVLLEANERPGLANHEPQPTAERFLDLLFPQVTGGRL